MIDTSGNLALLVLVHGAGGTRAMWRPQLSGLAGSADVVAIDLPAHGKLRDQRFTLEAASAAVESAIQAAGRQEAVVLGLSLGGIVAMDFASRHPERVSGLILSGCTIDYSQPAMRRLARVNQLLVRVYPEWFLGWLQAKGMQAQYPLWADEIVKDGFYMSGFGQAMGIVTQRYFPDGLRDLRAPILIIDGENDQRNRQGEPRILETLPGARLVVLTGAGHVCNLDDPEGFNAAVVGFLQGLPAAAAPA